MFNPLNECGSYGIRDPNGPSLHRHDPPIWYELVKRNIHRSERTHGPPNSPLASGILEAPCAFPGGGLAVSWGERQENLEGLEIEHHNSQ